VADIPEARYAKTPDGVYIAYQVVGQGTRDLVLLTEWFCSHVDYIWEEPNVARFLSKLGSFSRLILYDRRGMGASDRTALGPIEQHVADLLVVLDAAGSERAALFGIGDGGMIAAMFAATHPARAEALIMQDAVARTAQADDYPWGWPPEVWAELRQIAVQNFGTDAWLQACAPSVAGDRRVQEWSKKMQRIAGSPATGLAVMDQLWETDCRAILPAIQTPTLILKPSQTFLPSEVIEDLAARIPHARLVEVPGDQLPFFAGADGVAAEVQEFLTGERDEGEPDRVLATVMFTDIVGSTERAAEVGDRRWHDLLDAHDAAVRRELSRFRGREINTTGDGFIASFDGPARAIRCAAAITRAVRDVGVDVRAGLHTGECEVRGDDLGGLAVHIAARVATLAAPGEVLVSGTVKDLVAGSGVEFEERGEHELKGVPGTWRLFSVVN
jgi:class 3 adenylate cyclase/pimeloyl-ACP methyl ester carboxylesterase